MTINWYPWAFKAGGPGSPRHGVSLQREPSERCHFSSEMHLYRRRIASLVRSRVPNTAPDAAC